MRILSSQALSVIAVFNPELVVKEILTPIIDKCFSKALHIRHGAILGVGEILIGISGNCHLNRKNVLERAYKSLSIKERKIISQSDNQPKFKDVYD